MYNSDRQAIPVWTSSFRFELSVSGDPGIEGTAVQTCNCFISFNNDMCNIMDFVKVESVFLILRSVNLPQNSAKANLQTKLQRRSIYIRGGSREWKLGKLGLHQETTKTLIFNECLILVNNIHNSYKNSFNVHQTALWPKIIRLVRFDSSLNMLCCEPYLNTHTH